MEAIIQRLASIFAAEPDDAAKACAFLLALYVTTLVPLLTWAVFQLNGRSRSKAPTAVVPPALKIPTPEETSLLIRKRRSIYTKDLSGEGVDRAVVESMLEAANWAPTHGKTEPWRFVVMGRDELQKFIDVMIESLELIPDLEGKEKRAAKLQSKRSKMAGVQWALVICYKRKAGDKLMPEWEELAATSMSVQNMHLMATAHGAAGYWTSWGPEEARDSKHVKGYLGLEPEDKCIGVFLLGASDKADSYRARRGPMSEKVDWRVS